jgi:hypothetical protein
VPLVPVSATRRNILKRLEHSPEQVVSTAGETTYSAIILRLFGGQGLYDPGNAYEDQQVLIFHGRHGLLTWTAVVAKETGQMSMSIANLGRTYAQFGSCTPQQ